MAAKKPKLPKKTFDEINLAWQHAQTMPIRNKLKAFRQISFDILNSYNKEESSLTQINIYIGILRTTTRMLSSPQSTMRMLAKLIAHKLELTGNQEVKILHKVSKNITLSSATIMIGEVGIVTLVDASENELIEIINKGEAFFFSTRSDGVFPIQLRIIEASEPLLTAKEYRYLENSSQTAIINMPHGQIAVSDLSTFAAGTAEILLKVEPGNYKVTAMLFHIPNKISSYYIVMCKTQDPINNNFERIDELEDAF
jgi:hypothetical protein